MSAIKLAVALLLAFGPPTPKGKPRGPVEFETLRGFNTVLLTHVNAVLGSENLPLGVGLPLEPGVFVTITPERITVFDKNVATVANGRVVDPEEGRYQNPGLAERGIGRECKSACSRALFDGFHAQWRKFAAESDAIGTDVPTRVLLAAHAQLPARLLVDTAYAISETRPQQPPYLSIVVNGADAGVRSRPFALLPPQGISVSASQRPLGLRITMSPDGKYRVTAADPRFGRALEYATLPETVAALRDIKKRFPSKDVLIVDVVQSGTVSDVINLMMAVQEDFTKVVLCNGQRVRVGG